MRIETESQPPGVGKAFQDQAGRAQQNERKGDFGDDEQIARAARPRESELPRPPALRAS